MKMTMMETVLVVVAFMVVVLVVSSSRRGRGRGRQLSASSRLKKRRADRTDAAAGLPEVFFELLNAGMPTLVLHLVSLCIHPYIYTHSYMYTQLLVCIHTCSLIYIYVCTSLYLSICIKMKGMYTCIYAYMICIYACSHTRTS